MSILIISEHESDLSRLMSASAECTLMSFKEAESADFSKYSAVALLCGTVGGSPYTLSAALRIKTDEYAESGRPMFYEWCSSFSFTYTIGESSADGKDSRNDAMTRYIYLGDDTGTLTYGDLIDSQANYACIYKYAPKDAKPILYNAGHVLKHDHVERSEINTDEIPMKSWRLWYYDRTRLICSFRISNFIKARFAPFKSWCGIAALILKHLGIKNPAVANPYYKLGSGGDTIETFGRGMKWFDGCDIVIENGRYGVHEGLGHAIRPDGTQDRRSNVRVDCVGEVAGAYLFDHILNGSETSFDVYKELSSFVFEKMQVKSGRLRGMVRWSECAWSTLYGDDTARAILSTLLYIMYTDDRTRLPDIESALDFLITITGTDGLMNHGVDAETLTDERIEKMSSKPSNQYCAHRNAYYSAALLLAYRLDGKQSYLDTAVRGLSAIMNVYPNTMRAISETEELCRLIFPLSCLYQVTGSEKHKKWLYDVSERLEIYRYPKGGYTEVDPGYT
nr:hypothetical protein [Clostridia bacterium]